MFRTQITVHCLLLTFLSLFSSCTPQTPPPTQTSLLLYNFDKSSFLEYSVDYKFIKDIPFSIPQDCGLNNTFPAPIGPYLIIELNCPNGQTVLFLNTETDSVSQPISHTDSHFLAWTSDGKSAYFKIDSLGSPRVIRVYPDGTRNNIAIPEFTYDLSSKPDSFDFTFTLSRGLGYGSELYLAQHDGRITTLLYADQYNYISFARFSSDGEQIAFIKIPDTQTPFTLGELWVIPSTTDFTNTASSSTQGGRFLADVDAGHGYAANWSPDGKQIAFVVRENHDDENANQSSDALISNIYIIEMESGNLIQITNFDDARVETPHWSPDGNTLAFNVVVNGRMNVSIADVLSGEIKSLETESVCCPAWMRK